MLERDDLERLAGIAHALRPDWPLKSLMTFLERDHAARPFRDVAVALVVVACDPKSKTPKRMNEHGPWWVAAQMGREHTSPLHFPRCPEPGHTSYAAHNCGACRAEQLAAEHDDQPPTPRDTPPSAGPELVRAAMAMHGVPTSNEVRTKRAESKETT